jgi:hypothetical protein
MYLLNGRSCLVSLLLGVSTLGHALFAQPNHRHPEFNYRLPQFTFKVNPTCLINFFRPAIFVSSDFQLYKRLYGDVGAGWIITHVGLSKNESYNGLRARLGMRHLFGNHSFIVGFAGFEAKANYIVHQQYQTLCRAGCQYEQIMLINRKVQHYGLAARAGFWVPMGSNRKGLFELYGGVGYRLVYVQSALPDDAEPSMIFRDIFPLFFSDGIYHLPDLILGVNLGINFYKRNKKHRPATQD